MSKIRFLQTWYDKVVSSDGNLTATHTAVMMYAVLCYQKSEGQEIFDFYPSDCMKFAGISYNTFKKHLNELQYQFGMLEVHEKPVNQYTAYKVSLARFDLYEYAIDITPHPNSLPPDVVQAYQNNKNIVDRINKVQNEGEVTRKMVEEVLSIITRKKKKPQPADGAEPFWDKIVDAYWHWYSENIVKDEKPDWKNNPSESKAMRELVKKLKSKVFEVMEKKNIDRDEAWNSDNAASYVIGFLTAAINYEAPKKVYWYKSNFSLRIINTKFTELYVALQEKNRSTGGKAAESNRAATNKNIDDLFAKGKNKQRGQV